ncbi:MAG TPA: 50S ribosomal protein L1 [Dehalococcoidia bacterium]|nr:50S ribosomal protein L1 [Dehalococcoidia bacterium]
MAHRGKRYESLVQKVEEKAYEPAEAVALAKELATAGFDETLELHLKTGLDPRHADQQVRSVVLLPHGLGKRVRIAVFAQGEGARLAGEAGADVIGGDDLIQRIEGGWLDFDVTLATPEMMGRVGRLGRILGPRGLMPNPRSGTVVNAEDLLRAIGEARKGRVEFRLDRTACLHMPLGKASFSPERLLDNLSAAIDAVNKAKPAGAKGHYLHTAYLKTTMSPSISLDLGATLALAGRLS